MSLFTSFPHLLSDPDLLRSEPQILKEGVCRLPSPSIEGVWPGNIADSSQMTNAGISSPIVQLVLMSLSCLFFLFSWFQLGCFLCRFIFSNNELSPVTSYELSFILPYFITLNLHLFPDLRNCSMNKSLFCIKMNKQRRRLLFLCFDKCDFCMSAHAWRYFDMRVKWLEDYIFCTEDVIYWIKMVQQHWR